MERLTSFFKLALFSVVPKILGPYAVVSFLTTIQYSMRMCTENEPCYNGMFTIINGDRMARQWKRHFDSHDGIFSTHHFEVNTHRCTWSSVTHTLGQAFLYERGKAKNAAYKRQYKTESQAQIACSPDAKCLGYFKHEDGTFSTLKAGLRTFGARVTWVKANAKETCDCDWTLEWSCPEQVEGSKGKAAQDYTRSYDCCCNRQGWKQAKKKKKNQKEKEAEEFHDDSDISSETSTSTTITTTTTTTTTTTKQLDQELEPTAEGSGRIEGAWDMGFIYKGHLTANDGSNHEITELGANHLSVIWNGNKVTARLKPDGTLHWSDEVVWVRQVEGTLRGNMWHALAAAPKSPVQLAELNKICKREEVSSDVSSYYDPWHFIPYNIFMVLLALWGLAMLGHDFLMQESLASFAILLRLQILIWVLHTLVASCAIIWVASILAVFHHDVNIDEVSCRCNYSLSKLSVCVGFLTPLVLLWGSTNALANLYRVYITGLTYSCTTTYPVSWALVLAAAPGGSPPSSLVGVSQANVGVPMAGGDRGYNRQHIAPHQTFTEVQRSPKDIRIFLILTTGAGMLLPVVACNVAGVPAALYVLFQTHVCHAPRTLKEGEGNIVYLWYTIQLLLTLFIDKLDSFVGIKSLRSILECKRLCLEKDALLDEVVSNSVSWTPGVRNIESAIVDRARYWGTVLDDIDKNCAGLTWAIPGYANARASLETAKQNAMDEFPAIEFDEEPGGCCNVRIQVPTISCQCGCKIFRWLIGIYMVCLFPSLFLMPPNFCT